MLRSMGSQSWTRLSHWTELNPEKPSQGLIPPNPSLYPLDIHWSAPWLPGDQKSTILLVCSFTALLSPTFDSFKLASLASSQVSPGSAPASSCPALTCILSFKDGQRSPACSSEALLTTPTYTGLFTRPPEIPEVTM